MGGGGGGGKRGSSEPPLDPPLVRICFCTLYKQIYAYSPLMIFCSRFKIIS